MIHYEHFFLKHLKVYDFVVFPPVCRIILVYWSQSIGPIF